jgi:REP element-mobilizing transposase RayT
VSHAARPVFSRANPVHVTLRVRRHVWNLRSGRSFRRIAACFAGSRGRFGMRLIEFSVQGNHLHLIVEADGSESLTRGMQGLAIRIARALNAMMRTTGKVFADHYHSRLLRSPTELVNAIRYVLGNSVHHFGGRGRDPYSSAILPRDLLITEARSWLLREGVWRALSRNRGQDAG